MLADVPVSLFVAVAAGAAAATFALVAVVVAHRRRCDRVVADLQALAARVDGGVVADDRAGPGGPLVDAVAGVERAIDRARDAAAEAEADRQRMARALRAIPEGVVVVDDTGEFVFRNDVAAEFADARHGDALIEAAIRELVAEAVREGRAGTRTLELFGPPRRTMVISARPLLTAGRAIGALAIVDDITDRRRLEAVPCAGTSWPTSATS
jgi:PAS domain-containing protein